MIRGRILGGRRCGYIERRRFGCFNQKIGIIFLASTPFSYFLWGCYSRIHGNSLLISVLFIYFVQ